MGALGLIHEQSEKVEVEVSSLRQRIRELESTLNRCWRAGEQLIHGIGERRQIEAALRQSEPYKSDILDNLSDAVYSLDREWCFTYLNKAAEKMINRQRKDIIGKFINIVFPNFWPRFVPIYCKAMEEKEPQHYENLCYITKRWFDVIVYPFCDEVSIHLRDIHERKLLEQELQQKAALLEIAHDAILVRDLDSRITYWNSGSEHLYDWSKDEAIGKSIPTLLKTQSLASFESIYEELLLCGSWRGELVHTTKKGRQVIVSSHQVLQRNKHGKPLAILEINRDITERKQAEQALRESEERFYKAFHSSPVMMAIIRMKDNRYLEVNQKFLTITEYTREQCLEYASTELNTFIYCQNMQDILEDLMQNGRVENVKYRIRTRSGKIITTIASWELITLDGENCRLVAMQDISDKIEVEAKISRLDRLNLIGEMAASIGHEIRNPMTAIRGFLQMIGGKEEYKNDRVFFDLMIEELDRANDIISEYLGMAKDKRVELKPQYLDEVVKSLYPIIQAAANYQGKALKLDLSKPPMPLIDAKEIRQMILNMARNGLEAMSAGGTLTIGTSAEGCEIVLFIKDEGSGIDLDLLDKLGTPFVTTKNNGTGLGLAVCFSIAARHNARIEFTTGPDGTTFFVRFPKPAEQPRFPPP